MHNKRIDKCMLINYKNNITFLNDDHKLIGENFETYSDGIKNYTN